MFPGKLKCSFNLKSIIGVLVFSNLSELYQNHFSANTKDTSREENKFFIFLSFKITLVFLFSENINAIMKHDNIALARSREKEAVTEEGRGAVQT